LANQRRVLEEFVVACGLAGVACIEEIGGGLNSERTQFLRLMDEIGRRTVQTLVLAQRDRLTRLGFAWLAHFAGTHGCAILVLNQERLSPE
jgi:predicted site-specific integrase-resolvase